MNDESLDHLAPFTRRVIEIIRGIPPGSVMSYGAVAREAGSPRAARQVVRVLSSCSDKYNLPWHRVVNRELRVALRDPRSAQKQIALLRQEGIDVGNDGRVRSD